MDIRVIGGGVAALAFGIGGINYVGMDEVLSAELKPVDSVPSGELQAYMDSVVAELSEGYGYYVHEGEGYAFVGDLKFEADARTRTFDERVKSADPISAADRKMIKADIESYSYCLTDDAVMFTSKGYNYNVTIRDGAGKLISREACRADRVPSLRGVGNS